jgi:hypothetical protein
MCLVVDGDFVIRRKLLIFGGVFLEGFFNFEGEFSTILSDREDPE